jgi:hypothetical protein
MNYSKYNIHTVNVCKSLDMYVNDVNARLCSFPVSKMVYNIFQTNDLAILAANLQARIFTLRSL